MTSAPAIEREIASSEVTTCCVVGGGPAGVVLSYLLGRAGIHTVLLEEHQNFDREFRGDTIHPSVMQIMDELGLSERLLELRHTKIRHISAQGAHGDVHLADFELLNARHPYITMMPQQAFLNFMTTEAGQFPSFTLKLGAAVRELIEENGVVRGVRYHDQAGWHEIRALLTVAADGRFSRIRHLTGMVPISTSPPMDILWFKLSRIQGDSEETGGRFGRGHLIAMINRFDYWQIGYVIPKGSYQGLHGRGIQALRDGVAERAPEFADRVNEIKEWHDVAVLSVESNRLPRWHRPGLLLIGDAAHTMSPVGGVGINYAIQDAVVAANELARPLKTGHLSSRDLAVVQKKREFPTRFIQTVQALVQRRVLIPTLAHSGPGQVPAVLEYLLSIPRIRAIPSRIIGQGIVPVHVTIPARPSTST
jgi:2-polyprenyl-6-methoxyphenol hydroxylase-like FAD-dependent oxidoreductase